MTVVELATQANSTPEIVLYSVLNNEQIRAAIFSTGKDQQRIEDKLATLAMHIINAVNAPAPTYEPQATAAPTGTPTIYDETIAMLKEFAANVTPESIEQAIQQDAELAPEWSKLTTDAEKKLFLTKKAPAILVAYMMYQDG